MRWKKERLNDAKLRNRMKEKIRWDEKEQPNDAMSRWYAAANKRLDCRTWKKGIAAAEMKDLATVGLPQTCRLAPEMLGEWGPATSSFGLIAPNTSCDGMSTNGRLPFISAKTALSAEKGCADTDTRSQPRSWVNASITSFWDFSSQRTTNDGDFRTNQKFVDISYVVLIFKTWKAKYPKGPKDVMF